jgi:hypothetical protein
MPKSFVKVAQSPGVKRFGARGNGRTARPLVKPIAAPQLNPKGLSTASMSRLGVLPRRKNAVPKA